MTAWAPSQSVESRVALRTLAGESEAAVIDRALAEGEVASALAVLTHSVTLSDRNRAGAMLRVAAAYAGQEELDLARALYWKAGDVAVLSPDLADWSRAELFMQAGLGALDLGKRRDQQQAKALFDQARVVMQTSAEMKPVQKQQLTMQLTDAYVRAGMKPTEAAALFTGLGAETDPIEPARPAILLGAALSATQEDAMASLALEDVALAALRTAQETRRQSAETLVTVLEKQAGPPRPALVADLANALVAEDAALAQAAQCTACPELFVAELRTQWAMRKWQAAQGGFGASLVTSWEDSLVEIESEARQSWEALFLARRRAGELSGGISAAGLETGLLRGQLLVGLLGLAPGLDVLAGSARLRELADQEPQDWVIETTDAGGAVRFQLQAR